MQTIVQIANTTIRPAKNSGVLNTPDGDTQDIIKAILAANRTCAADTKLFARQLIGKTTEQTIRNVWAFVKDNIKYVLDPIGEQFIKTPARTWLDGFADCKSRSIFQASLLQNLGIPFAYRFASYDPRGTYTHVYIVAKPKGGHYVSDPDMPDFNTEKKAAATLDKNIVMSNVYTLSGVGSDLDFEHHKAIGDMHDFDYDLAITKHRDKIEKALVERDRGVGSIKSERYQDRIDMVDSMIDVSKDDSLTGDEKTRAIGTILEMVDKGHFDTSDAVSGIGDIRERSCVRKQHHDKRLNHVKTLVKGGYKPYVGKLKLKNIVKKAASSFKAVNKKIFKVIKKAALTPLQLPFKASLEVLLPKVAPFFLYLFIKNQSTINNLPEKVKKKRRKQEKIAKLITGAVGMKEDHFMGLLRNGITKHYGKSPETVLSAMVKGPIAGIGIIDDIIKAVFAIIKQLAKLFKKKDPEASSASIDDAPSPDDFGTMDNSVKRQILNDAASSAQEQSSTYSEAASSASKATQNTPAFNTSDSEAANDSANAAAADDATSDTDSNKIPTVNRKRTSIC